MNSIPKGLFCYRTLLTEIGDKDKTVMNSKNFETRSMEAFHYTLKFIKTLLYKKDNKQEDKLVQELKQTLTMAREVKDQYLEDDDANRQKRHFANCVYNQIEGLMSYQNTADRTSENE